jgi:hypothetical protein
MLRRYPPEFRRGVLDLIASGRKVADVARGLGVSGQTIYNWRDDTPSDRFYLWFTLPGKDRVGRLRIDPNTNWDDIMRDSESPAVVAENSVQHLADRQH